MKKKLIIITGAVGSGKSTVSEILFKRLEGCFLIEGNKCGIIEPIIESEENLSVVIENISYITNSYINNTGSKYIILNWTIHSNDIIRRILSRINSVLNIEIYLIILKCDKEELDKRIYKDIKEGRKNANDCETEEYINMYDNLKGIIIDTTNKVPSVISDEIINIVK